LARLHVGIQNTRNHLQVLQVFPSSESRRRLCLVGNGIDYNQLGVDISISFSTYSFNDKLQIAHAKVFIILFISLTSNCKRTFYQF